MGTKQKTINEGQPLAFTQKSIIDPRGRAAEGWAQQKQLNFRSETKPVLPPVRDAVPIAKHSGFEVNVDNLTQKMSEMGVQTSVSDITDQMANIAI